MPRACGSCSIIGRRSGSAPASASTCTSWPRAIPRRLRPPATRLVLFSSSWKDRAAARPRARRRVVDARIPVSVLNFAWHRLEWPPVEWFAGPVDIAHSPRIPLLMPARRARAGRHRPRPRLPRSSRADARAEIRRDYPALAASHAAARRPGRGGLGAHRPRGRSAARRAGRAHRRLPARRAARRVAPCTGRRPGRSCSSAPSSRARICRRCSRPTQQRRSARMPGGAAAGARPGGAVEQSDGDPRMAARSVPPLAGGSSTLATSPIDDRQRALRGGVDAGAAVALEGFGMTALEAMQAACRSSSARGALPEVVGDAGVARRPDSCGRHRRGDRTAPRRTPTSGGGAPKPDGRRRAQFSWSDERRDAAGRLSRGAARGGGRDG